MKSLRISVLSIIMVLLYSQIFAAEINIGPQPYPNLLINTPHIPLIWYEMYVMPVQVQELPGSIGACYSSLQGDAIDGKHIGIGIELYMPNIWGPYIGIVAGPGTVDISWGNFYDNKDLKFFQISDRIQLSLLIQVVRIDYAAINLYAGGDIALSFLSIEDENEYEYESSGPAFPYGYHLGIQATGKYKWLAISGVIGFHSMHFYEQKLEYENIDDGNTYYFKMPAETISNYLYGVKLTIIPWHISVSYTTQTFKKSDTTGFPEYSQNSIMITYTWGQFEDAKEEKKETKPEPGVETL